MIECPPNSVSSIWKLADWLNFLENRHSKEVHLRLTNARYVANILHILRWDIPIITVAGTNGKGSTVASLNAVYVEAGYRVGCFTSPHLIKFNERISVNNQNIKDEDLCALFHAIERARNNIHLSFFEFSFLAALLYFKKSKLDVIILEVGIGGRLDATNIIDADLAIITTIDIDHKDFLGPDKESIGYEKAGIMRPNKLCIYADINPPASIKTHAKYMQTEVLYLEKDYNYQVNHNNVVINYLKANISYEIVIPVPKINIKAAVCAIIASDLMSKKLPITINCWINAMNNVSILGRLQIFESKRKVLLDVAHNPQSAKFLAEHIKKLQHTGNVHVVFSAFKDKDLCGMLKPLVCLTKYWYPALMDAKRASDAQHLVESLKAVANVESSCFKDPHKALSAAVANSNKDDLLVVYGSFVLVGAIMERLINEVNYI